MKERLAVIAIGGNSLIKEKDRTSIEDQIKAVEETCKNIADLVADGWNVVITHGNGPQVGFLMRRSELAAKEIPAIPLEIAVADTQGAIGYMIQQALINEFHNRGINKPVVTVVTRVLVDGSDPAFANPTKPIGSFMTREKALEMAEKNGWKIAEDAGRGWRRVVPSPEPQKILEDSAIQDLISKGYAVVCVGGGGIPVIEKDGKYEGVSAVIDKDYASSLLARTVGADAFIVTTGVSKVAINFGKSDQRELDRLTVEEATTYLKEGHFPPGSMGPKMEAILNYLKSSKGEGIITSPEELLAAVKGKSGTCIR
ncbi:MAG: carbamate kinase [Bacillota bacterium]